jgi:molybdenum-dependent DNA-binding transcriptional regulator ModE
MSEIGFTNFELEIAKPVLSEDNTMIIDGNFEFVANKIKALVDQYKGTVLTEDNIAYVKAVKAHFTSLRTGIENKRSSWKKIYIDPASKTVDAMCKELQQIVAEGENALKEQLEEYDQKRKDELTLVLTDYINEAVKKYELNEKFACEVIIKKNYYNKTQNEEDSYNDIMEQAKQAKEKQNSYEQAVMLIQAECEGTLLVVDSYIRQLEYKNVAEIILLIKLDKKKAAELLKEVEEKQTSGEKVTIGEPIDLELAKSNSFEEDEMKEKVLRIRYKPEQAKLLSNFFKENKIEFEFINI